MMADMVMITGGAGFLGSHLAERLLDDGCSVVCVDNFCTGVRANVEHLSGRLGFRLIYADVTQALTAPAPVAAVLHFASPASPADYLRLPVETLAAGSAGTLRALDLARRHGARFLLASTSEVYGDPLVHPQPEGYWGNVNPVGPRSVYDEAKRFGEAAAAAYRRAHGVDAKIARIFNTYGPRMRSGDGRVVPAFIGQALTGESLTVAGDGSQTRSLCYVDDLVDGLLRLLWSDHAGPVNLGGVEELTVLELAAEIRDLTGSDSPVVFVPRPEDDPQLRRPDTRLARELLGWEPKVSLRDGLAETIGWFRGTASAAAAAARSVSGTGSPVAAASPGGG